MSKIMIELRRKRVIREKFDRLPIEYLKNIQDELTRIISIRESDEKRRLEAYAHFQQNIEMAKTFFGSLNLPTLRELENLHQELKNRRAELIKIFSSREIYSVCRKCKGICCNGLCDQLVDVAYLALSNFTLPKPTRYSFPFEVRPHDGNYCPFLNKKGCILGENKFFVCLQFCCGELAKEIDEKMYSAKLVPLTTSRQKFEDILHQTEFPKFIICRRD